MASMEENLLRYGLQRVADRMAPKDERAMALRAEVSLYNSPYWSEFQRGLEARLIETLWQMADADDPVEVRVLQRDVRRMRERIRRPADALDELKDLNKELEEERRSALAAAGLTGRKGVAVP